MRAKKLILGLLLGVTVVTASAQVVTPETEGYVFAVDLGDDLGNGSGSSSNDNGIGDLLKDHQSVTDEQMQNAQAWTKPITDFFGNVVGVAICLITSAIFVVTVADLCYIALPFTRGLLYRGAQQNPGGAGGYGAMGGYGGRMGGYGMGGMSGMGGTPTTQKTWQIISDEAVQCAVLLGSNQQQPQASMMGMPGQPSGQQVGNMSTKSVIFTYFKKRVFFMVLLAICLIMLTSSIFLGTGVNIANWLTQLIDLLNSYIPA